MGTKKKNKTRKVNGPKAPVMRGQSDEMIRWLYLKDKSLNGVMCLSCGAVLVSHSRHDFVPCFCENETYVDGGQSDYIRVGGHNLSKIVSVKVTIERGDKR